MSARVAVLQFPGVNCEDETLRALARVGLEAELFRWTREPGGLREFAAYVLPGGFCHQDRVRAGALAAKSPLVDTLAAEAERGKPVLGICNGAQVLVEAGLVPGGAGVELALARNRGGYVARWIYVRVEASPCLFTKSLAPGAVLPLPMAHGEGRFTSREPGRVQALAKRGQTPLRYASARGTLAKGYPENPSGADANVAAACNAGGNVLAVMPHPERALDLGALGRGVSGEWAERRERAMEQDGLAGLDRPGPGLAVFDNLRRHLMEA